MDARGALTARLDDHVAAARRADAKRGKAIRKRLREMSAAAAAYGSARHRRREVLSQEEEADELRAELRDIECGRTRARAEARVAPLRPDERASEDEVRALAARASADLDGGAVAEAAPPPVEDDCQNCGPGHRMRRLTVESLLVCETCGDSVLYADWNWNAHGHDKVPDTTASFSYKRQNHFVEWLQASQGRERCNIPDAVLYECGERIRAMGVDAASVTPHTVRQALKAINARKYYENSVSIWARLTGKTPPRFTAKQEEELKTMFLSIQEPFEKVRAEIMPERRNFLSYSYCLFKFCELLALDHFLPSFQLLKGRDKLRRQDVLFKPSARAGWQFFRARGGVRRRRRAQSRRRAKAQTRPARSSPRRLRARVAATPHMAGGRVWASQRRAAPSRSPGSTWARRAAGRSRGPGSRPPQRSCRAVPARPRATARVTGS